jgi:hypothetical protein
MALTPLTPDPVPKPERPGRPPSTPRREVLWDTIDALYRQEEDARASLRRTQLLLPHIRPDREHATARATVRRRIVALTARLEGLRLQRGDLVRTLLGESAINTAAYDRAVRDDQQGEPGT